LSVEDVRETVRDGGLLAGERPLVAMISGGRDSVCLLDVAVALRGADAVLALHVNYGLREEAGDDERHCSELCERLGVELSVARARSPARGNVQAWARGLRYDAARALAATRAAAAVATILYRLAASPGRRALLGMLPCEGGGACRAPIVRPLLGVTREQTAAYCREAGLSWREDASNADARYARARVRESVVPALRAIHPAADANVLRTARLLRDESEALEAIVERELDDANVPGERRPCARERAHGPTIALARLAELPPALARLVIVRLAEQASGEYVPQAGERVGELLALTRGGSARAELHIGGLVAAVIERGVLSMRRLAPEETSMRPRKQPPDDD
jgi:tRNA(Ile)-lysidine synthase